MAQNILLEWPRTFVERVKRGNGSALSMVKTYDRNERPCWFLLKANERSAIQLKHTNYEDMIDLTQFGEVVDSGWGHEPDGSWASEESSS